MRPLNNILVAALATTIAFAACKREDTDSVSKTVKVTYPGIKLKGDSIQILDSGASFTDPGAVLTDDISGIKTDIQANDPTVVNTSSPGLYTVSYTAANKNGFETISNRIVIIKPNYRGSVALSGAYKRQPNQAPVNITSLGQGLYLVDNVGGVLPPSDAILPVYLFQSSDTEFDIPFQPVPNDYGNLGATNEEIVDPTTLKWKVVNAGFGTSIRTFVKQ